MWTFLLLNFALTLIAESQSSLQPTQGLAKQSRDCLWQRNKLPVHEMAFGGATVRSAAVRKPAVMDRVPVG